MFYRPLNFNDAGFAIIHAAVSFRPVAYLAVGEGRLLDRLSADARGRFRAIDQEELPCTVAEVAGKTT